MAMATIVCRSTGIPAELVPIFTLPFPAKLLEEKYYWKNRENAWFVRYSHFRFLKSYLKIKDYRKKSWKCLVRPILTLLFPTMLFERKNQKKVVKTFGQQIKYHVWFAELVWYSYFRFLLFEHEKIIEEKHVKNVSTFKIVGKCLSTRNVARCLFLTNLG